MPKGRAYIRQILRDKYRKQYTVSTAKMVCGFLISLFASIFLGSYLENYGPLLLRQIKGLYFALSEDGPDAAPPPANPPPQKTPTPNDIDSVEQRLRQFQP